MTGTLLRRLGALDRTELVLVGTAVTCALAAHDHLPLLAIGVGLLVAIYLQPDWLRSPWPWLVASAANLVVDARRFLVLDNHIVLTHYWVLAVGLSLLGRNPDRSLELNGRLLIGLTMALAVLSKLLWGEYLDAYFFEATMLADDRFSWIAHAVGIEEPQANYRAVEAASAAGPVPLDTSSLVRPTAVLLSVATLLTEGALAVTHLVASDSPRMRRMRTAVLASFCVATYAIVPVAGFASVLLVMASADRGLDRRGALRRLGAAVALFAWGLAWQALH